MTFFVIPLRGVLLSLLDHRLDLFHIWFLDDGSLTGHVPDGLDAVVGATLVLHLMVFTFDEHSQCLGISVRVLLFGPAVRLCGDSFLLFQDLSQKLTIVNRKIMKKSNV